MTDQRHLDAATLDMLQEVLEDGFAGLLETFLSDSRQKIASLRSGLASADSECLRRNAHSLKGSSSNLGANSMAELSLHIEEQAREDDLQGLESVLEQLVSEFECVERIMERKLEQLRK